ncbi:cationic amino acid transporter 2-like isoform X3 [Acropora palmata]|uniref:cationic amino acid transporter 2-like isoform X3 n=1 Tax=Acropora palmata TaxID=6131 RepID=UPI003DA153F4
MANHRLCINFTRKKQVDDWLSDSPLRRCLTLFDLTSLGTGAILGAGLYVAVGELSRGVAGPAIILSFLLASVTALLCVFFYTEMSCRIPKAGSAYFYTYVELGEIWAFIVGWTILLEYIIASASLARACSGCINLLFQGKISYFFMHDIATWNHQGVASFPDFLAAAIVLAVIALVCYGARNASNVQKIGTIASFLFLCYVVIYGLCFTDFHNWSRNIAPSGVKSVLGGAANAFFAFAGFDIITSAAQEAVDPERNIPLSLILTITICTISLLSVAAVLTLVVPYEQLASFVSLAKTFSKVGNFPAAEYIIACGGICATLSALVSLVFSPSRILYTMSFDGLLSTWFSQVTDKTHSPARATLAAGISSAILALIFEIKQLVELLSIGILLAYAMVALCVLVSRYKPGVQNDEDQVQGESERKVRTRKWLESFSENLKTPEDRSQVVKKTYQTMTDGQRNADEKGTIVASLIALQLQPQNSDTFSFMVPGVPFIPALSIFIDVLLIANLHWMTFARFGMWMAIGLVVYILYGYQHSTEAMRPTDLQEGEFVFHDVPDYQTTGKKPQMHET